MEWLRFSFFSLEGRSWEEGWGWCVSSGCPRMGGKKNPERVETLSEIKSDKSTFYRPCRVAARDRAVNEEGHGSPGRLYFHLWVVTQRGWRTFINHQRLHLRTPSSRGGGVGKVDHAATLRGGVDAEFTRRCFTPTTKE